MSNFSSIPTVFRQFFTWIELGDFDLHFSHILATKANVIEEESKRAACQYHQRNQSIHENEGVTVTSLSASLLQKTSSATDWLCQITLNRKSLRTIRPTCIFKRPITLPGNYRISVAK
jgi:hypothetical protein